MTAAKHLEFLVEEPSMEAFLRAFLPRLLPAETTFEVHPFQGKTDLIAKLESRLRGYANWLPADWRLFVLLDRDEQDCRLLKAKLEDIAQRSGLTTRTRAGTGPWQIVNRVVIEELEAWYFGDWDAVKSVYPRVTAQIPQRQGFRDPDAIAGGTWEAFERVMQRHGYFEAGLAKIEAARAMGGAMSMSGNRSASFRTFHSALLEVLG